MVCISRFRMEFFGHILDFWALLKARFVFRRASMGRGVRLSGTVHLQLGGQLRIGDGAYFHRGAVPTALAIEAGGRVEIGEGSIISYGCIVHAGTAIRIGQRCRLGYGVVVVDNDRSPWVKHLRLLHGEGRGVEIGDDVWIGTGAIVLPGVRIGHGSIIAPGSLVSRDVPPHSVLSNHPSMLPSHVRTFQKLGSIAQSVRSETRPRPGAKCRTRHLTILKP
jgi:acetyltransferase-like isoleucine patch superfamily enzyme